MTIAGVNDAMQQQARARQNILTKPQGSLGRLEDIACWFAARQGKVIPDALQPYIAVFAGDHGVTAEGVSAFPSVVTGEMVKNFAAGGAAINVLAKQCHASLSVVNVGVAADVSAVQGVVQACVRPGSGNIAIEAAMSMQECEQAMEAGRLQARQAIEGGANLLIAGDMGIGNTTASACLICALAGLSPEAVVGFGTGVDDDVHQHKVAVVHKALVRAGDVAGEDALCALGGLEIAAMSGFYLQAAAMGVPVVIDGFISTAAAMVAQSIEPASTAWMLASHVSQELGHRLALEALGLEPLIDFSMRLGEGSGAALLVPLLQSSLALHREMATFEAAGVSNKDG